MSKIAFLSTDNLEGFVSDDYLACEPLAQLGWEVETVSWRNQNVYWKQYAAVIIRTTWDYHNQLAQFLDALEKIESATRLANPLSIVRWNANKTYLRDLSAKGARVVPTIWNEEAIDEETLKGWFAKFRTQEIVIKPTVSASAEDTLRVQRDSVFESGLFNVYSGRQYMVQPFMDMIIEEGEFSLFYLCDKYSHTILKTPKAGDFRVQEEHGGIIQAVEPSRELLSAGENVLRLIDPSPLYARIDFVRHDDEFVLMELELIEPSLYLRMDDGAPARFAKAIDRWVQQVLSGFPG